MDGIVLSYVVKGHGSDRAAMLACTYASLLLLLLDSRFFFHLIIHDDLFCMLLNDPWFVFSLSASLRDNDELASLSINILHMNDIHSHFDQVFTTTIKIYNNYLD